VTRTQFLRELEGLAPVRLGVPQNARSSGVGLLEQLSAGEWELVLEGLFESLHHVQGRGLFGRGRPGPHHPAPFADLERLVRERRETLGEVADQNSLHRINLPDNSGKASISLLSPLALAVLACL